MNLSRLKPAVRIGGDNDETLHQRRAGNLPPIPELEQFLEARDFTGALTLLQFQRYSPTPPPAVELWCAYCAFHLGDHKQAMDEYEKMTSEPQCSSRVWTNLAACYFYLGLYREAREASLKGEKCSSLNNRLLFHVSHKMKDEKALMAYHRQLQDVVEDQMSLASIHYLRSHFQEAIDIYKRLLLDERDLVALNVYLALCYYKLDYFDVSQEVLDVYLQRHPESVIAVNLKAANHFRLYNGKQAEAELQRLKNVATPSFTFANDLIKHNIVVFRGGEDALKVLRPLVDVIPEARLNLVIYHLKQDDIGAAYELMADVEPSIPQEYILKAVVNAALGQEEGSREHNKTAQQCFQLIGGSTSECDTIPGRQSMASCFFLLKQFKDVLLYLDSIKSYFHNDDTFKYNYAQTIAALGRFREAEEVFTSIGKKKLRNDYVVVTWLARCFVMNGKPRRAWELYLKMDKSHEAIAVLQIVANDCYSMGYFFVAAKAFDALDRLDPSCDYWEAKRGACVGVFQSVVAAKDSSGLLRDVLQMLHNSSLNQEAEKVARVIRKWAKENQVPL